MFPKTRFQKFFRASHPVQIEMQQLDRLSVQVDDIGLHKRVGRAFDFSRMTRFPDQGARERCFAGAQIAVQINGEPAFQHMRQRLAKCACIGLVVQIECFLQHRSEWYRSRIVRDVI